MRRALSRGRRARDRARGLLLAAGVWLVAGATGACSGEPRPAAGVGGQGGAGQDGSTGTSSYSNLGVCGERGRATADATSFDGYAERFILGEEGFGSDVCAVRFGLKRVGDAPGGCADCTWTHLLEYGDPAVVTDIDGVCASSDLALDAAAIAQIVGTRVALGFAKQPGGAHGSARMLYVDAAQTWEVFGNATWEESSRTFTYDYRGGLCNYGP